MAYRNSPYKLVKCKNGHRGNRVYKNEDGWGLCKLCNEPMVPTPTKQEIRWDRARREMEEINNKYKTDSL